MARQRGGGRRGMPPNLRGTLGTLLRTTLSQVGAMRDIALDQARHQRVKLDTALLSRRVRDTLADLGEVVYEMAVAGELGELEEVPEIADCLAELEELEQRIVELEDRSRAVPAPATRGSRGDWRDSRGSDSRASDSRGGDSRGSDSRGASRGGANWSRSRRTSGSSRDREPRVWRPSFAGDDGTVSAFGDAAPDPAAFGGAAPHPASLDDRLDDPRDDEPRPARRRGRRSPSRRAGGGIAFVADPAADPDEDLAAYMNDADLAEDPDE